MMNATHSNSDQLRQMLLFAFDGSASAKPSRRRAAPAQQPKFYEEFLQLPLFKGDMSSVQETCAMVEATTVGYIPDEEDSVEFPYQWSNDGIQQLHSVLLYESIRILAGSNNGTQKREVLEWIFEADYVGTMPRDGKMTHIFNWEVPWSFLFCCRLEHMSNPEIIRDFIRGLLPKGAATFFN